MINLRRKIYNFVRYRLHPKHRYHILKIGSPGYCDPRYQLILVIVGILTRYAEEERRFSNYPDTYSITQIFYKKWLCWSITKPNESIGLSSEYIECVCNFYKNLYVFSEWWGLVKNHPHLDNDPDLLRAMGVSDEWILLLTVDKINSMLNIVVNQRGGLWT